MKLHDDGDFTALSWIKPALDATLEQAREALEAYVDNPAELEPMHACAAHLHQVQGTLRMVELYGAAMVVENMERLASALLAGEVRQREEGYSVLMRGMVQLPDYLERLQSGHKDIPIVLLPLLNDLRAVRGENLLTESSLFSPDLGVALPPAAAGAVQPLPAAELRAQALRLRLAYQAALLKWFRDEGAAEHLRRLVDVLDRLRAISHGSDARRLWWIGAGVIEAVEAADLEASVAVKLLFGRVDREIARFASGGEPAFAAAPPRELTKNLLYYIAHSDGTRPSAATRADEIRRTYSLDTLLPTASELQHAQGSMTGHNKSLLGTVSAAIKEDLLRVKEVLDIFLRSGSSEAGELTAQVEVLDRVGDTLGMLGLGVPRRVVGEQRDVIRDMARHQRPVDEGALLDVAGALLYVEASLDDHIERLGAGDEADESDGALALPKAEVRKIVDTLMREAAVNLQQAKQDIIAFIESPWAHERVEQIPRLLEEIIGALRMLGLNDASELMTAIVRFVQVELLAHKRVPTAEQMDKLADALAAVEYFLEATREQRRHRDRILEVARDSLDALGYWPLPPAVALAPLPAVELPASALAAPAPLAGFGPATAEPARDGGGESPAPAAAFDAAAETRLPIVEMLPGRDLHDLVVGEARTPLPAGQDLAGLRLAETGVDAEADTATGWIEVEEEIEEEVPVDDALVAGFDGSAGEEIDNDIREVFIEEVEDELVNLRRQLPQWQRDPGNLDELKPIRRAFHTLKGSGRLVGALALGEFSWKVESLLNHVLDRSVAPGDAVVALVEHAVAAIPVLLGALRGETGGSANIAGIMHTADRLAAGEEAWVPERTATTRTVRRTVRRRVPVAPSTLPAFDGEVQGTGNLAGEAGSAEVSGLTAGPLPNIDPVLFDILQAEVAAHLGTIDDYLAAFVVSPAPASEALLRAVHTLNGAIAMVDIPTIGNVLAPLESYIKRLRGTGEPPSADGVSALQETAALTREVMRCLEARAGRLPESGALAARVAALRDALPEPAFPVWDEAGAPHDAAPSDAAADADDQVTPQPAAVETDEDWLQVEGLADAGLPTLDVLASDDELAAALAGLDQQVSLSGGDQEDAPAVPHDDVFASILGELPAYEADVVDALEGFEAASEDAPSTLPAGGLAGLIIEEPAAADGSIALDSIALDESVVLGDAMAVAESSEWVLAGDEPPTLSTAEPASDASTSPDHAEMPAVVAVDEGEPAESAVDAIGDSGADDVSLTVDAPVATPAFVWPGELPASATADVSPVPTADDANPIERADEIGDVPPSTVVAEPASGDVMPPWQGDDAAAQDAVVGAARDEEVPPADAVQPGVPESAPEVSLPSDSRIADVMADATPFVFHPALAGGEAPPLADDAQPDGALELADVDDDLLDIFAQEGADILDHADTLVAGLRESPHEREHLVGLQRDLHTLKGGARMAGLAPIGDLSHAMESLVDAVSEGRVALDRVAVESLERGFDRLHVLVQRVAQRRAIAMPLNAIARFESLVAGEMPAAAPVDVATVEAAPRPSDAEVSATPAEPVAAARPAARQPTAMDREDAPHAPQEMIRVRSDLLDSLVNYAGEVSIYRSRLEQQISTFRFNLVEFEQTVSRLREQLRKLEIETEAQIIARYQREQHEDGVFDPLELDRFSQLQQLSRALGESVSDLVSIQGLLDDQTRQSETLLLQQSRVSSELQEGLMRTRMVPFDSLVPNLRRTLRQAAQDVGKRAQLKVDGAQGEMDRNLLERMKAPFEHMLRNALAHGIEKPDDRVAAGKPAEGTVSIAVSRDATEVVLRISDDGRGMDREAIRRQAIERGLLKPEVELSDRDLYAFVLESGFSTARELTQLAGRGVGMDVVHNEIKQLGGSLVIDSTAGQGTTFTIRLPFTLAVTQAILVKLGESSYAIPMSSVQGVARIARDDLERRLAEGNLKHSYAGEEYTIYDLAHLLGVPRARASGDETQVPLLMTRTGDQRAAVRIDGVVGSREIVVKSVGPQVSSVPGIFGATIMGDGSVVMILDLAPLVRRLAALRARIHAGTEEAPAHFTAAPEPLADVRTKPQVMVVDDSITMRKVTTRVLERADYEVLTAKDGLDALEKLQDVTPDLLLLDIEMPRMDGYELATYMRNDARLRRVPIIMITSRTGEKHRQRALEIGVERYLGKPYQEDDLLRQVQDVLGRERV